MFWSILAAIVLFGGVIWAIKEKDEFIAFMGIVLALLIALAGIFIGFSVGQCCITPDEAYDTSETNICAFSDNAGTFFVGRHHSDSAIFYSYIEETNDDGKVARTIRADAATLYENEKEQPHITTVKKRCSNLFVRFFFFTYTTQYRIYIPPNSIQYDYSVDLK